MPQTMGAGQDDQAPRPDDRPRPKLDIEAWERQKGETQKAFAAFVVYRDLPGFQRSFRHAVDRQHGLKPGQAGYRSRYNQLCKWSSKYKWVDRCREWDSYKDRVSREEQIDQVRSMHTRQATIAAALQQKAYERLKKIDPSILSPSMVIKWFVEAAKMERTARGEPETLHEALIQKLEVDLTQLTDEQLDKLIETGDVLDALFGSKNKR